MTFREHPKWLYHATNAPIVAADPGEEETLRADGYRSAQEHFDAVNKGKKKAKAR
jgi:hypothetical protein